MNVLLINGCWTPNIGNAFVNLGMEGLIRTAFPDAEIFYSSNINNRWFYAVASGDNTHCDNVFDITKYLKNIDLVVWGGMMLTEEFVRVVGNIFHNLSDKGIPILFLGAGADKYTAEETSTVVSYFSTLRNYAIVTRGDSTFSLYQDTSIKDVFFKGMECAFFLPEYAKQPQMDFPEFDIECFDRIERPMIDHCGKKVIYTHHDFPNGRPNINHIQESSTLVSELPYDYLTLYANVDTTYSERVHACVATLAYGGKAMLFSSTPRKDLFEKVFPKGFDVQNLTRRPLSLDMNLFKEYKNDLIQLVRNIVLNLQNSNLN